MKILYIIFFTFVTSEQIIKNVNLPICKNCKFYKPDPTYYLSRCEKFGEKNIFTGKITYDYASLMRNSESDCGQEGKYFELEKNPLLKQVKYKFLPNRLAVFLLSFFLFAARVKSR